MTVRGFATWGKWMVLAAIAVVQIACGGDDCKSCTTATSCPSVTKQCTGYTATVQQCSGSGDKMCCAKGPNEVSCTAMSDSLGSYSLTADIVSFSPSDPRQCLRFWIDAAANGWVDESMGASEKEAAIRAKMAEVSPRSVKR